MSHSPDEPRPSLPSIQFLLQESVPPKPTSRHKTTRSISSLPSDLQRLSLYGPSPSSKDDSVLPTPSHQSSWMVPQQSAALPQLPPMPPPSTTGRPPGASHARSYSEITLAPPQPVHVSSRPHPSTHHRQRHQTHRRAVSANTVDMMLHGNRHTEQRAYSNSPPEHRLGTPPRESGNDDALLEALNVPKQAKSAETEQAGRYLCPYCQKPFTRPSSLRIHTHSHTGEKPFRCPEEGCGRRFSVQSNMRRHLRVHRLAKPSPLKNGN